jgi:predicted TIM-barrel fold metal-dependent hydrolase
LRIDAHHSCSQQYTLAYLSTILKRNRFEGSLFVGAPQPTPDYVLGIIAPIRQASPEPKLRGVQIASLDDLPQAAGLGLAIDLVGLLPEVPRIAAAYPNQPLVIDHLGHPPTSTWARDIETAANFPNVYCKLTGLAQFDDPRPHVQLALSLFGPGRLMFGSDWPTGLPDRTWKASLALFTQSIGAQPIEVREELLGGTATRVYGV